MIKRLLPLISGLILGIGGGTGLYIVRGGGQEPVGLESEDSETHGPVDDAADTTHVAAADTTAAHVDTTAHESEGTSEIARALLAATRGVGASDTTVAADDPGALHTSDATTSEGADAQTDDEMPVTAGAPPTSDASRQTAGEGTGAPGVEEAGLSSSADLIGGPVDNEEAAKRVAKIFSQMQARDAARVLSLMERSEVELILKQLDNRSAAKILSGLSPEQAAALSAVLIRGGE